MTLEQPVIVSHLNLEDPLTNHYRFPADDRRWHGLVEIFGLDASRQTGEIAQACLDAVGLRS